MRHSTKTYGMLIEIVMSFVSFAIVCVIVLQIFTETMSASQVNREKSMAMNCAQSVVSIYRSDNNFRDTLNLQYGKALLTENDAKHTITFDENMRPCSPNDAAFEAQIRITQVQATNAGILTRVQVVVHKGKLLLVELNADKYVPTEVAL